MQLRALLPLMVACLSVSPMFGQAELLTGANGGPQTLGMTTIQPAATPAVLDWSLVSTPPGSPISGSPALTLANLGPIGVPPASVTPGLPGYVVAHDFSFPPGVAVCVADGITGGVLCPVLAPISIHGLFAMDLFLDDPTAASIGAPFGVTLNPGLSIYVQSAYLTPTGSLAVTNLSGWNFVQSSGPCSNQESFDNLATGLNIAPTGWTNPSSGVTWFVHTGSTGSNGTGPSSAHSPPNYMYCETSSPHYPGILFVMDTCHHDVTSLSLLTLNFQLSRIGGGIGTLNIYQDDGPGTFPFLLATFTGADPSQSQGGVEWSAESIPFIPLGVLVAFRFEYTSGTTYAGDLAIDDYDVQ